MCFSSYSTSSTFSPERNVLSMTLPSRMCLSLVRTKAPPLPGLTCWKSTMAYGWPSKTMRNPFLNSAVDTCIGLYPLRRERARSAASSRSRASALSVGRPTTRLRTSAASAAPWCSAASAAAPRDSRGWHPPCGRPCDRDRRAGRRRASRDRGPGAPRAAGSRPRARDRRPRTPACRDHTDRRNSKSTPSHALGQVGGTRIDRAQRGQLARGARTVTEGDRGARQAVPRRRRARRPRDRAPEVGHGGGDVVGGDEREAHLGERTDVVGAAAQRRFEPAARLLGVPGLRERGAEPALEIDVVGKRFHGALELRHGL